MESLQQQILRLGEKVDALYQIIESLDCKLSQSFSNSCVEQHQTKEQTTPPLENFHFPTQLNLSSDLSHDLEHKDFLMDGIYPEINSQTTEKPLAAEIQITRLTAQLTAAYNRIAALEDQLMRQRTH